jgi:hypothetical protein
MALSIVDLDASTPSLPLSSTGLQLIYTLDASSYTKLVVQFAWSVRPVALVPRKVFSINYNDLVRTI